ncbi:MAG: glycosyltransferase family 2 protein [Hyphomicrobiales bacterium]|nr:MAG: glycosyltransferase family 2 protein [Hyphomicrobiales bacterium]
MKVAVMMAAYNAAATLDYSLGSLLRQRGDAKLDIIVVNDGSTDGTGDVVRRIAAEAPEIRLIETPNQGITRTRNMLLDALAPDTDLVTTLDSDDLSPAGRFARDIRWFAEDPDLDMHYGYMQVFRGAIGDDLAPVASALTARVRGIHLGTLLARLPLVQRIGKFDDAFAQAEDTDYIFRALELSPNVKLVDDLCYFYRRHNGNISRDTATARRDFARATLMSIRRRRATNAPGVPAGFFDGSETLGGIDWWHGDD